MVAVRATASRYWGSQSRAVACAARQCVAPSAAAPHAAFPRAVARPRPTVETRMAASRGPRVVAERRPSRTAEFPSVPSATAGFPSVPSATAELPSGPSATAEFPSGPRATADFLRAELAMAATSAPRARPALSMASARAVHSRAAPMASAHAVHPRARPTARAAHSAVRSSGPIAGTIATSTSAAMASARPSRAAWSAMRRASMFRPAPRGFRGSSSSARRAASSGPSPRSARAAWVPARASMARASMARHVARASTTRVARSAAIASMVARAAGRAPVRRSRHRDVAAGVRGATRDRRRHRRVGPDRSAELPQPAWSVDPVVRPAPVDRHPSTCAHRKPYRLAQ